MSGRYILDADHNPVEEDDLFAWGRWLEAAEVRVERTIIDDVRVSTVFLGLDHSFSEEGPPILFETMIFGGHFDQEQDRCATWDEAVLMHHKMCERVRKYIQRRDT